MVRTITVPPNFPLKRGDYILVREPNGVRLRYDVTAEVPKDRKKSQAFSAKVSIFGGRA